MSVIQKSIIQITSVGQFQKGGSDPIEETIWRHPDSILEHFQKGPPTQDALVAYSFIYFLYLIFFNVSFLVVSNIIFCVLFVLFSYCEDCQYSCNIYYSLNKDTLSITHPSSTAILIHKNKSKRTNSLSFKANVKKLPCNSLHNTRTSPNDLQIILWRLLSLL